MSTTDPIPGDRPHVVPYLTVEGAAEALDWYVRVFDATEHSRMPAPDGRLMHSEITFGGWLVYVADDFPEMSGRATSPAALGATTVTLHRYVTDCDALVARAAEAGATVLSEPQDMFWGDRLARICDPFGHEWWICTHVRDVPVSEMVAAGAEAFADMERLTTGSASAVPGR